ncbi:unnamed protein product [Euphydryas editha]|uniref:Uncharacterized protein n=1 Tax=Euphydryas editha TaxID=104508 RepID=A0AAU9TEZ6_EUPED|nr:unnamed protein product [Euphydryas editha]
MSRLEITFLFVLNLLKYILLIQLNEAQHETTPHVFTKSWRKTPKLQTENEENFNLNDERKNNDFDYNYEEWDEKEPDYYNFFINNTVLTFENTTTTIDTTTDPPATTILTFPPEFNPDIITTTEAINDTIEETDSIATDNTLEVDTTTNSITSTTRITSTTSTASTTTASTTTESTISTINPTTKFTATESPEFDIFNETTATEITMVTPETIYVLNEINEVKTKIRGGYFTSGLIVLLRKVSQKNPEDLTPLLVGLHAEVTRMNSNNQLQMFGPLPLETFTTMIQLASVSPSEMIQLQAKEGITLLENRRSGVLPDMNAILDILDTIFNDDDLHRLAIFLKDIETYPNTSLTAIDIASEGIETFIMMPYQRIEGTTKERLLMLEVDNAVRLRLFPEHGSGRRKIGKFQVPSTRTPQYIKKHHLRTDSITDLYTNYVKNKKIMKRMKYRMKLYKDKFKVIKQKEKGKSKRGPTTKTTTTTTTTPKPTMHRSKYYMRKYVKKNLYRMKTTTKKTTKFKFKYYGKIRKFNIDTGINSDLTYSKDIDKSSSEGYYSDINYKQEISRTESELSDDRDDSDESQSLPSEKMAQNITVSYISKAKLNTPVRRYASYKKLYKDNVENSNKHLDNKLRDKFKKILNSDDITDVDEEAHLKANIQNAVYHKDNFKTINDNRRFFDGVTNKIRKESFSDEEVELKRNIYKAIKIDKRF